MRRVENIHGYNIAKLRGIFKRAKSSCVSSSDFEVPRLLIKEYKRVKVFIDTMFVNNLLFLHTISEILYSG